MRKIKFVFILITVFSLQSTFHSLFAEEISKTPATKISPSADKKLYFPSKDTSPPSVPAMPEPGCTKNFSDQGDVGECSYLRESRTRFSDGTIYTGYPARDGQAPSGTGTRMRVSDLTFYTCHYTPQFTLPIDVCPTGAVRTSYHEETIENGYVVTRPSYFCAMATPEGWKANPIDDYNCIPGYAIQWRTAADDISNFRTAYCVSTEPPAPVCTGPNSVYVGAGLQDDFCCATINPSK